MGRRSINTTKSGKYMNPTDQASKLKIIQTPLRRMGVPTIDVLPVSNRKGGSQKGTQKEQETAANGKSSSAEK